MCNIFPFMGIIRVYYGRWSLILSRDATSCSFELNDLLPGYGLPGQHVLWLKIAALLNMTDWASDRKVICDRWQFRGSRNEMLPERFGNFSPIQKRETNIFFHVQMGQVVWMWIERQEPRVMQYTQIFVWWWASFQTHWFIWLTWLTVLNYLDSSNWISYDQVYSKCIILCNALLDFFRCNLTTGIWSGRDSFSRMEPEGWEISHEGPFSCLHLSGIQVFHRELLLQ